MKSNIIPEPLEFEWDKGNQEKNLKKHGVINEEAEQVFGNEPLVSEDLKHSNIREKRYQCLGLTDNKRKLFISFTIREDKARIISARPMSQKEKKRYVKESKTNS